MHSIGRVSQPEEATITKVDVGEKFELEMEIDIEIGAKLR